MIGIHHGLERELEHLRHEGWMALGLLNPDDIKVKPFLLASGQ